MYNYFMYPIRKLFTIIIVSLVLLIIGRNLTFLPKVSMIFNRSQTYQTSELKKNIQNLVATQKGHYSVMFMDLKTPNSFGLSEHTMFTGASVNKVHIVAALYHLAGKGDVNLDQKITLQKKDIQDYGTGSLRYQKSGGVYSLRTLAHLTLQQSDNTAAYIISNRIGRPTIQSLMSDFGLTQTNMENNKTSLADISLLYTKIYHNEITSPALSKELLGFMTDTDIEDRLPKLLPSGTAVYHKTGDGVGFVHDVGIIASGEDAYFLGVMTSDVGGTESEAADTIAQISKAVYDFMQQQD